MTIGFTGLLTLLFVAAKLFGYVSWSWLVVFSPILIGWAIFLLLAIVTVVLALVVK